MDDTFKNLDQIFNIEKTSENQIVSDVEVQKKEEISLERISSKEDEIERDYDYTRSNLYSLIEKGQEAINSVLELAQESDSPRAYEVFGQLIKNVSDTTDKLINLQQKMKELDETGKNNTPTTVNNTLFVGSTVELSKMLKTQIKELNDK